jgi:nucleotide-binding universal stress UspA family protein
MKAINKILVAVDFSTHSISAAKYAVELAKDVTAKLHFINILNQRDVNMINMVATRVPEFPVDKYVRESLQDRRDQLRELIEELEVDTLNVETNVRVGIPYEALLQEIEEKKPDLLIMGTKGRSDLVGMIIGSCAQKMFRRCPIPLLSIRGE